MPNINLYSIGAAAIIALGLLSGLLYYRGGAIAATASLAVKQAQLDVALEANKQNQDTIQRLSVLRESTDKVMSDVNAAVAGVNKVTADSQRTLVEMSRTNAQIRTFLDTDLPADLKRMLNHRPAASTNKN